MEFEARIIESTNGRAVAALLDRRSQRDAALERRVARIVDNVRRDGDRAVRAYARQFDRLEGDIEVPTPASSEPRATLPRDVQRAISIAARNISRVAAPPGAPGLVAGAGRRHTNHAACAAARSRRLLRACRAVSAALLAADDGHSGERRRRARHHRGLSAARRHHHVCARGKRAYRGSSGSVARTPSPRSPTAPGPFPRVDKIVGPGNAYVAAAKAMVAVALRH